MTASQRQAIENYFRPIGLESGRSEMIPLNKNVNAADAARMHDVTQQAMRFILESPGIHDFEIIQLKNTSAIEASRMLDEMFNGPKAQPGGGGPGFSGLGPIPGMEGLAGLAHMFGGGGAGAAIREERIRIVPDASSNKLLVRANPLDMYQLRKLVQLVDGEISDSKAFIKTNYVALKNAYAAEVAEVIKDVYRDHLILHGRDPANIQNSPFGGIVSMGRASSVDANGNRVDPVAVQQAIDVLYGRRGAPLGVFGFDGRLGNFGKLPGGSLRMSPSADMIPGTNNLRVPPSGKLNAGTDNLILPNDMLETEGSGATLAEVLEKVLAKTRPDQNAPMEKDLGEIYQRPTFTHDRRLFSDLLQYAPGLNSNGTDIQCVLEAELKRGSVVPAGSVDPAARVLIDRARSLGWSCLTLGDKNNPLKLHFNGAGHYFYERTLPSGLVEQVYCDGQTLLHLYPELGLGARRTVHRLHRGDLADLIPWHVLPADDLARGVHVKAIDERTVALVPLHEKPHVEIRLLFAKEGRLCERQLFDTATAKVLYRETYDEAGTIVCTTPTRSASEDSLTIKLAVAPAPAPNMKPDTGKLVLVPMPLRTGEFLRRNLKTPDALARLSDDDAIALIAADCLEGKGPEACKYFKERFYSKKDYRIGFFTLITAGTPHLPSGVTFDMASSALPLFNVHGVHPDNPLSQYLLTVNLVMHTHFTKCVEVGELPGPKTGFVQRLAGFFDQYMVWHTDQHKEGTDEIKNARRERTLAYMAGSSSGGPAPSPPTPLPRSTGGEGGLGSPSAVQAWILADMLEARGVGKDARFHVLAADVYERFGKETGLHYVGRYERARHLWQADQKEQAVALFRQLHADALQAGMLPLIDSTFVQALKSDPARTSFAQLARETSSKFAREKQLQMNMHFAWQLWQLGETELSNEALDATMTAGQELIQDVVRGLNKLAGPAPEKNAPLIREVERMMQSSLLLAGIDHCWRTSQWARTDVLLQKLLEDDRFAQQPSLWRLGATLAQKRGQVARITLCLEKALDLEYKDLPAAVNLQVIRQEYGELLKQYQQTAIALNVLQTAPPRDFLARVVKTADRWRTLDPEVTAVCQQTAKILQTVGERDLAWDYLTTPIGLKPNEAGPWVSLAGTLVVEGDFELADRAYAAGFAAEPTNAQILWDRAGNLKQLGRGEQANQLYRQIADGTWQPRFQGLQGQARSLLNRN